jgi:protease-4
VKKRTAWILVAAVAAISIGAAGVGLMALLLRGHRVASWGGAATNYLFVRLDGEIPEEPPTSDWGALLEKRPPALRTLVESLDRAARDPKVTGVVVRVGSLPSAGWGQVQEIRDALSRFRAVSRKPALAHIEFCGNKEYYVATACSKIYAVPTALLEITGLAAEVIFMRGTLEKLGVEAQFEGVGKYKNAPNQFTETGFTAPHREQMDALLDSLYGQYLQGIATGRKKTEEDVRRLLNAGPYDAREALKVGLVDGLVFEDELQTELKGASRLTPGHYVRAARGTSFLSRPKIALVYAVGEIVSGNSGSGGLGGSFAGSETVAAGIREAREDDGVKAIVLRVDSPGGSGTASEVIWHEVQLARRSKPVVVSMGDLAASGGYYISMGSDVIVAEPGTITGSIGVFSGKFSLRGLYDKLGLAEEVLTRGDNADIFSEYRPWSPDERARIRGLMVNFYTDFVKKVSEGRRKSTEDVDTIAQGRVWTGAEALKIGLVDKLGGLDTALGVARERAHMGTQDVDIVVLPERKGFFETLMSRGEEEGIAAQALPRDVRAVFRLSRLFADSGPVARLPFELRVR